MKLRKASLVANQSRSSKKISEETKSDPFGRRSKGINYVAEKTAEWESAEIPVYLAYKTMVL